MELNIRGNINVGDRFYYQKDGHKYEVFKIFEKIRNGDNGILLRNTENNSEWRVYESKILELIQQKEFVKINQDMEIIEQKFRQMPQEYYSLAKAYALSEAQEFDNYNADWGNSEYDKINAYKALKKNYPEEVVKAVEEMVKDNTYTQSKDENKVYVANIVSILDNIEKEQIKSQNVNQMNTTEQNSEVKQNQIDTTLLDTFISDLVWRKQGEDEGQKMQRLKSLYSSFSEEEKEYIYTNAIKVGRSSIEEVFEEVMSSERLEMLEQTVKNFFNEIKQSEVQQNQEGKQNLEVKVGQKFRINDNNSSYEVVRIDKNAHKDGSDELWIKPIGVNVGTIEFNWSQLALENAIREGKVQDVTLEVQKKQKVEEAKEYLLNFEIRSDIPLSHKDIYAFIAQVGNKGRETLKEVVNMYLPGNDIDNSKFLTKKDVLDKIIYPIKEQGIESSFKNHLVEKIIQVKDEQKKEPETSKKYSPEDIQSFYSSYEIRPNTPLSHQDIYAFSTQIGKGGFEKVTEIASAIIGSAIQLSEFPQKGEILSKIVYPIRDAGVSNVFKEELNKAISISEKEEKNQEIKQQNEMENSDSQKMDFDLVDFDLVEYPKEGTPFSVEQVGKLILDIQENGKILDNLYKTDLSNSTINLIEDCVYKESSKQAIEKLQSILQDSKASEEVVNVLENQQRIQMKR
jgi:hypothetical protein